jgi:hypothetical protein
MKKVKINNITFILYIKKWNEDFISFHFLGGSSGRMGFLKI